MQISSPRDKFFFQAKKTLKKCPWPICLPYTNCTIPEFWDDISSFCCPTDNPFQQTSPAEITNHAAAAMMRTYPMKHSRSHHVINKKLRKIQTIFQNKNVVFRYVVQVVSKYFFYTFSEPSFSKSVKKEKKRFVETKTSLRHPNLENSMKTQWKLSFPNKSEASKQFKFLEFEAMSLGTFRMCKYYHWQGNAPLKSGKLCQNKTFAIAFSAQHSKSNSSRGVKIHSEYQRFTSKFAALESSPVEYLHIWSLSIFVVVALTLQLKLQSRDKLKDTELNSICNIQPYRNAPYLTLKSTFVCTISANAIKYITYLFRYF